MARWIWVGAAAIVVGVVLGILVFGTSLCAGSMMDNPWGLFVYSAAYVFYGRPCDVTVVLGTVLFWGGIVLLGASVLKSRPPLSA